MNTTITNQRQRRAIAALSTLLLAASILLLSNAAYIWTKARVAQLLLQASWRLTLSGMESLRPWPWADTYPVARLRVDRLGVDEIVLAGASGRTMAFGPGHVDGSGMPGDERNCVITAHRDTHFAFLRELRAGDAIEMQDAKGRHWTYRVRTTAIVDKHDTHLVRPEAKATLSLVTCYPFFAVIPGGPQRYVVTAERASS